MAILKVKDANGEWKGVTTVKGEKGDQGCDGGNILKDADRHRGIVVALDPNKYYTIESLNGDVGIYNPTTPTTNDGTELNTGRHVSKIKRDGVPYYQMKYLLAPRITYTWDRNDYNKFKEYVGIGMTTKTATMNSGWYIGGIVPEMIIQAD